MRLIVGVDDCGHQYAIDVSTFEKLQTHYRKILEALHGNWMYTQHFAQELADVQKAFDAATTDDELEEFAEELIELTNCGDASEYRTHWGRDTFTELEKP